MRKKVKIFKNFLVPFYQRMYSITMINTYNESMVHHELKELFAEKYKGQTEVKKNGFICDVVHRNENNEKDLIIEIQSSGLSNLSNKIRTLLTDNKVILVYPLATKTKIQTISTEGKIIQNRTSPKKKNIYSIFEELFKIYDLFDNENFSLCVIPITQTKIKQLMKEPVQTLQKSRRFKKNYLITDRLLDSMENPISFSNKKDFIDLLPKDIPEVFSSRELKKTEIKNEANKMLWVLNKMGIIEIDHKEGNLIYYRLTK